MVHKPIAIMILPVFVAGILMLGILAATGNAQESGNTGNRQNTFLPETEENNAHFAQESNNHPMCLNEHTEKWEPCVVKNSPQKHESSNTPPSQESSKTENGATSPTSSQETSNTGTAAQGAGKVAQESSNKSSVPVRTPITLTPIQTHITTKAHMTTTNEQLSKNGRLTELTNVYPCRLELGKEYRFEGGKILGLPASCGGEFSENPAADCRQTSDGGSWICLPKTGKTVERAPHTGNLYEMREAAKKVPVTAATTYRVTAAEVGPGWREVHPGEQCAVGGGEPLKPGESATGVAHGKSYEQFTTMAGQHFCRGGSQPSANGPALNSLAKVHNTILH